MTEQIVAGMWGPRPEAPQQIGQRLAAFLERLSGISPVYTDWRFALDTEDPGPVAASEPAALARSIAARNPDEDVDYFGCRLALLIWRGDEPAVELSMHAGGIAGRAPNVVSLSVRPDLAAGAADVAALVDGLRDVLVALAEVWDVDHGTIYHHELIDELENELELDNSDPRCGRAVFLSHGRVRCGVPEGLPGIRIASRDGGLVLDLVGPNGVAPDLGSVVAANAALRTTGALAPLPFPMDRPKL